jgi:pyruvate/2-oxoglutarate dehydrogenase complex dihydrolipoamide acyltransferase (E2) component
MTQHKAASRQSEHERVAQEEKKKAMDSLRERANENGTDEDRDQRGGAGQWPGKELTRDTLPNADSEEEATLPDDVQRDISQDGVVDDPSVRGDPAP